MSGLYRNSIKSSAIASAFAADSAAENPFADPTEIVPVPVMVSVAPPPAADNASRPSTTASTASNFAAVETIRRPFLPSMDDEMAVAPGEEVRILNRFDDGWAIAEKVATGKQGLMPIDCLRAPEEDLPAFLAKKRISSYRASTLTLTAVSRTSVSTVGAAV